MTFKGLSLMLMYHDATTFDTISCCREVMCSKIIPFSFQEKFLALMVPRNSWSANLNNIHVVLGSL